MAGPYAGPGRHVDSGPRHRGSALLPRPTRYRRLSTGVTGSSPRSTAAGFGQIGEAPYGSDASGSGLCDADARRFAAGAERAEPGRRGRPAHA